MKELEAEYANLNVPIVMGTFNLYKTAKTTIIFWNFQMCFLIQCVHANSEGPSTCKKIFVFFRIWNLVPNPV